MTFEFICSTYIPVLLFAALCSIYRYRIVDNGAKIISVLLLVDFITECIADISAYKFHTNLVIYNVHNLFEIFIICLYFNSSVDTFKKNNAAIYIALVAFICGILNLIFFQDLFTYNTNFLLLESFLTIVLSLYALYRLFINDEHLIILRNQHFWFAVMLLFFWCVTFMNWGMNEILNRKYPAFMGTPWFILWLVNIVYYLGTACVFIFYKKMHKANE